MKTLIALLTGILFGAGLALSGMTDTAKVLGFLDLFGDWVPDLLFVMGGALVVSLLAFQWILKRKPLLEPEFSLPTSTQIDRKLLLGASLFGIGWGVYGYCPGPAIASLAYLSPVTIIFVLSMLLGMLLGNHVSQKIL